jgi:hypothetical protein
MKLQTVALVLLVGLTGCGAGASSALQSLGASPAATPSPRLSASPTAVPTTDPTTKVPEDDDLAAACDAIGEFRETGPLLQRMTEAAFEAYETGDYDGWETAATRMNDQFGQVIELLDKVPNVAPYREWKRHTLTIMLGVGNAIVAYDDGIRDLDLSKMEEGNDALSTANESIDPMNAAAAEFESEC